jgi:hypothetical protein
MTLDQCQDHGDTWVCFGAWNKPIEVDGHQFTANVDMQSSEYHGIETYIFSARAFPNELAEKLTTMNIQLNSKVVPTINLGGPTIFDSKKKVSYETFLSVEPAQKNSDQNQVSTRF